MLTDYPDLRRVEFDQDWDKGKILLTRDFSFLAPAYAKYIFIYKNHENMDNFLPSSMLKKSLIYTVATYYPPLTGRLESDKNDISIVWNKEDRNMPVFTSTVSDIDYSQLLKVASSCGDILAPDSPTGDASENQGKIPLFLVKATRLEDNSALALCISYNHMVMDGLSAITFMKNWGHVCKQMISGTPCNETSISNTPIFGSLELDRYSSIDTVECDYDEIVRISSSEVGPIMNRVLHNTVEHRLFVSPQQQRDIRNRAHAIGVSFNSLFCAMIWSELNKLRYLHDPDIAHNPTGFNITSNIRKCLGIPDEYCSNAILTTFTGGYSVKEVCDMDLADVAAMISEAAKKIAPKYLIGAFKKVNALHNEVNIDTKESKPKDVLFCKIATIADLSGMVIVSNVHFCIYEIDFGAGVAEYVRPILLPCNGVLSIWPGPLTSTGERDLEFFFVISKDIDITKSDVLREFIRN